MLQWYHLWYIDPHADLLTVSVNVDLEGHWQVNGNPSLHSDSALDNVVLDSKGLVDFNVSAEIYLVLQTKDIVETY